MKDVTFSEVFQALPMHKVVDGISYSRFLPKSAKSQFGHSEEGASRTENQIFQPAIPTVCNMPPGLTKPLFLTTHTNFSTIHREPNLANVVLWDLSLTLHAQKSTLMKERDKGVL